MSTKANLRHPDPEWFRAYETLQAAIEELEARRDSILRLAFDEGTQVDPKEVGRVRAIAEDAWQTVLRQDAE